MTDNNTAVAIREPDPVSGSALARRRKALALAEALRRSRRDHQSLIGELLHALESIEAVTNSPEVRRRILRPLRDVLGRHTLAPTINALQDAQRLTPNQRYRLLLTLAASGLTNREMGEQLGITEETIKSHMRNLFVDIGARNRAHAVHLAHLNGWLSPPHRSAGDPA